jgi:serine/threonine protein kinase
MNESQISYEANASINNHLKDHKIKKKFKLSLYQLQKITLLGAGSSGEVYLVQDTVTKKKLALKTVKYTEDEKTKTQIETEVKLSTLLKHENIIRIYATYFLKGRINFVMEYMDRGTIADLLKKVKKIPEKFVGLMTCQVLKGLAYCQKDKRIIHRDLKPSNILVNSKGEIKIADFGVSTMVEGSWAQKKTMIGTYIYMAPERIDADCYYINCDVWSLGIIVMECIMGFYPYIIYNKNVLPNSVWIVHELIENNPVPNLDNKIYSQELIDFANKCLTKDTKKRPTAAQLMNHPFIQRYENLGKDDLSNWLKTIN